MYLLFWFIGVNKTLLLFCILLKNKICHTLWLLYSLNIDPCESGNNFAHTYMSFSTFQLVLSTFHTGLKKNTFTYLTPLTRTYCTVQVSVNQPWSWHLHHHKNALKPSNKLYTASHPSSLHLPPPPLRGSSTCCFSMKIWLCFPINLLE